MAGLPLSLPIVNHSEEPKMKHLPFVASLLFGLGFSTVATAHPDGLGHRHIAIVQVPNVVSPLNRALRHAAPYCATYGCGGSVTATGPLGNTLTRSGSGVCADGTCTLSRTVTGPLGETATFDRAISR